MAARYLQADGFTAVLTPHFLDMLTSRHSLLPKQSLESMLERLWAVGIEDTCTGFRWGQGYCYYKCKWNVRRQRWELEFISFTPGARFHTHSRKFAVEVHP